MLLHVDKGSQQKFTETILLYRQQPILLARDGSLAWFFRRCRRRFRRYRGRLGRCNPGVGWQWGLGQLSAAIATHGCIRWVHRLTLGTLIFFFSNSWWSKTHISFSLIKLLVGHLRSHAGIDLPYRKNIDRWRWWISPLPWRCLGSWSSDTLSLEIPLQLPPEFAFGGSPAA